MMKRRTTLVAGAVITAVLGAAPSAVLAQSTQVQDTEQAAAVSPLVIRVFGGLEWSATDKRDTFNSFLLGQFDLFLTSSLSERIDLLAEIVLEGSESTRVVTDLERLQVTFRLNDHLHLSGGRYHTGIGFYNTAFHHGAFFETVIGRPRIFAFEDEGGVLPVHETGLTVRGTLPGTGSGLHYLAEIGNGRSWSPSGGETEARRDENDAKATNVGVFYRPDQWPGFEVGTSFYRDTIPLSPLPSVSNRIGAAYLAYRTPAVEVLAEWLRMSHRAAGGPRQSNEAGYLQASKAWGRVRPYYRYDRMVIDPGTPIVGGFGSFTAHTLGIRLDPAEWIGLKAQYERSDEPMERRVDSLRTQLVFVF